MKTSKIIIDKMFHIVKDKWSKPTEIPPFSGLHLFGNAFVISKTFNSAPSLFKDLWYLRQYCLFIIFNHHKL